MCSPTLAATRPLQCSTATSSVTAASMAHEAAGDGAAFRAMYDSWLRVAGPLIDALLSPFPPVRAGVRMAVRARPAGLRDLARLALVPLRRFVAEEFDGEAARLLLAGSALHADLTPENAGSALFGWLLTCLGQQHGFPVPVGGAARITDALVRRALDRGVVAALRHRGGPRGGRRGPGHRRDHTRRRPSAGPPGCRR